MSDKPKKSFLRSLWDEVIRPWGEAILFAWAITTFLISMVGVDGNSMLPNLRWGERVVIPKYETWLHRLGYGSFQRGDILVVKPPLDSPGSQVPVPILGPLFGMKYRPFFIKRLVGLPGDKIRVSAGEVFVNGEKVNQAGITDFWQAQGCWDTDSEEANHAAARANAQGIRTLTQEEITVPAGEYFVMGDNRSPRGSEDSRIMGTVPLKDIAGRAALIVWPVVRKSETKFECGVVATTREEEHDRAILSGKTELNLRLLHPLPGLQELSTK
ncbi:signal peptidase I [Deinococcus roseus]|uniref:Signal peptidase I n=1 Tax=Deinococcus roseus TaxID=392414 RepID=A0ABQ2D182_9DEIO|nr:signal peptidase I [Deinococcus roseus]GGJ41250.1 signal peptidase I [Deinococcus roseus]